MSTALAMHLPRSLPALKETAVKFMRAAQRAKSMSVQNEARAGMVIDAALVVGAAAGISYLNGMQMQKTGAVYQIGGHDADLLGGLAIGLTPILFPEILGKYSEKAGKIGIGMLAANMTRTSFTKGQMNQQTAQAQAAAHPSTATQVAPPVAATAGVVGAGAYRQ